MFYRLRVPPNSVLAARMVQRVVLRRVSPATARQPVPPRRGRGSPGIGSSTTYVSTTYVLGRQHGRRARDADEVDAVAVAVLVGQVVPQVAAVD